MGRIAGDWREAFKGFDTTGMSAQYLDILDTRHGYEEPHMIDDWEVYGAICKDVRLKIQAWSRSQVKQFFSEALHCSYRHTSRRRAGLHSTVLSLIHNSFLVFLKD